MNAAASNRTLNRPAVYSEGIPRNKVDVRVHIDFRLSGA